MFCIFLDRAVAGMTLCFVLLRLSSDGLDDDDDAFT